jgi:hypothetical protein
MKRCQKIFKMGTGEIMTENLKFKCECGQTFTKPAGTVHLGTIVRCQECLSSNVAVVKK